MVGPCIARVVKETQDSDNWRTFCSGAVADRLNDPTVFSDGDA